MRRDIKEVVKDLGVEVKPNVNYDSMVHLFYKGAEICAAPKEIEDAPNPNYTNEWGAVHPDSSVVLGKIKLFIDKFDSDPEFRELFK